MVGQGSGNTGLGRFDHIPKVSMSLGAHNHPKPISVEESVIISRLEKLGMMRPRHASRDELQAWIDENRHLVEDGAKTLKADQT